MNGQRKIAPAKQKEIVAHFLEHGLPASEALCVSLSLNPRYGMTMAARWGLKRAPDLRKHARKNRVCRPDALRPTDNDHRWAWAIERGPVVV